MNPDETNGWIAEVNKGIWKIYTIPPLLHVIKILAICICLYIGNFVLKTVSNSQFTEWLAISIQATSFYVLYLVIMCVIRCATKRVDLFDPMYFFSIHNLFGNKVTSYFPWLATSLKSLNIIELCNWLMLALCISIKQSLSFLKSLKYVACTYGIGFICFIIILGFISM